MSRGNAAVWQTPKEKAEQEEKAEKTGKTRQVPTNREMAECLAVVREAEKTVLTAEVKLGIALMGTSLIFGVICWLCVMIGNGHPAAWLVAIAVTLFAALYVTKVLLEDCMRESLAMRRQAYEAVRRFCGDSPDRALTLFLRYAASGDVHDDGCVIMLRNVTDCLIRRLPTDTAREMRTYIGSCRYGFLSAFRIHVDPETVAIICQEAKKRQ